MADESKFSLATLNTKQKVIGVAVIVIVIFIIYEVISIFSSSSPDVTPPAPTAPAAKPMSATSAPSAPSTVPTAPTAASTSMPIAAPSMPAANAPVMPMNSAVARKDSSDTLKEQEEQQKSYLDSLNQLQLLKLKREIAETNQAIAAAKLATETANKSMSDLLTQPAPPTLPLSSYTNKSGQNPSGEDQSLPIKPPTVPEIPFTVVSVTMQSYRWMAVLSYQNKYFNVGVGDTLIDGSVVATINRNGVTLVKDGKRRKIEIASSAF